MKMSTAHKRWLERQSRKRYNAYCEPWRCPNCGHLLIIAYCLECRREAEKNRRLLQERIEKNGDR